MNLHREILRHVLDLKLSGNQTHSILNVSRGTVHDCAKRAQAADLNWTQVESLSDEDLFALLFPDKPLKKVEDYQLDWEKVFAELMLAAVKKRCFWGEEAEAA